MPGLNPRTKSFFFIALLAALTTLLMSCGGGGGSSTPQSLAAAPAATPPVSQAPEEDLTGVVGILLKDAPNEEFTRIIMRITRVELLRDDGEPVMVFSGDKEIDLLQLQNFYDMLALSDQVPVGEYQKIRLQVVSITLYCLDEDGVTEISASADVPANGKVDLNPRGSFTVSAGHVLLIEIDLDARKSIHAFANGNGRFKFRPVVFVDIEEHEVDNGLIKLSGTVGNIAHDRFFFDLCELETQFHTTGNSETDGCVLVNVFGHTRIFDADGEEIPFSELDTGNDVTVIGIAIIVEDGDDDDVSIDPVDDDTVRMVQINAIVIQRAAPDVVLALEGKVLTELDDRQLFEFAVLRGQDFIPEAVTVLVKSVTRILDAGDLSDLDASAIQPGTVGEVIGIIPVGDPDVLHAALIFLKLEDDSGREKLAGIIQQVRDDGIFILAVDNKLPAGDQCIAPTRAARYFVLTETEDGIEIDEVDATAVKPLLGATVFGEETNDDGCFEADVIVMQEVEPEVGPV